jgi:ribonucleoside-diphosphate reductase alpha chain
MKKKILERGTTKHLEGIPRDVRAIFRTAHEIHYNWHIKMQSAFQKYTENAVSKTINMENGVRAKDVKKAHLSAWKTGCKGITIFRDGCKEAQVLNLGTKGKDGKDSTLIRPFKVTGATYRLNSPIGTAFVTINQDENNEPLEVFINVGKAGSDVTAVAEALGRTISTALRFRGHLSPRERAKEIAQQLSGIGGRRSVGFGANKIRSLPDAIAVALSSHFGFKINNNGGLIAEKYTDGETEATSDAARAVMEAEGSGPSGSGQTHFVSHNDPTAAQAVSGVAAVSPSPNPVGPGKPTKPLVLPVSDVLGDICPSCGATSLIYEEGCSKCYSCGYSEC